VSGKNRQRTEFEMPITLKCGTCQTVAEVPDAAAGKQGKCRKCGAVIRVPDRPRKICIDCKADVASSPRVKDAAGQYRCQSCYDKRLADVQRRQAEIEVVSAQFNRIKRARRLGTTWVLSVWTAILLLVGLTSGLADKLTFPDAAMRAPLFLINPITWATYVIPLVVLSIVWPAYRQNPKKLGEKLQSLIDGGETLT
jgi:hypothetical protein